MYSPVAANACEFYMTHSLAVFLSCSIFRLTPGWPARQHTLNSAKRRINHETAFLSPVMITKSKFFSIVLTVICLEALLPAGRCQIYGYLTIPMVGGYNFVANPFDTADNTLASVVSLSSPPVGTAVYLWDEANQQYAAPSLLTTNGWSANFSVPPGTGFVISSTSSWTLTLTGIVLEGTRTHFYAGTNKF